LAAADGTLMTGTPTNGGRDRSYQALRESEELHRATLGSISDAVFLADDEGAFTFICPNVDVIFGYAPDEVQAMGRIGRFLGEDLFDPGELKDKGEIRNVEREVTAKSGERRVVLIHLKRVSIRGGTVLCTCRDVTELKQVEKELAVARLELAHAARLALVGELAASIVHEIKQPLTAILANASAARRLAQAGEGAPDGEIGEILRDIHAESSNARDIVDRLQSLMRKRPLEMRPLDLNTVAKEVLQLVAADARRRNVNVRAELQPSLPMVEGDRVSLQHAILNLVVNAMDAIEGSEGAARLVALRTGREGATVECAVTDTGHGIAAGHLPRLFDAFFTTKEDGVGLGLAIARSIVEAHAGRIWAEDHAGRGATFRLALPVRASGA
jgi:PAS domain S-box-containing protein